MLSKEQVIDKIRGLKPSLYKEFAVQRIGLFGSFNQETQNEGSDIDLLIELERPVGWKFFTLELYLEKIFGRKIDLVTKNALKAPIKEQILNSVYYI